MRGLLKQVLFGIVITIALAGIYIAIVKLHVKKNNLPLDKSFVEIEPGVGSMTEKIVREIREVKIAFQDGTKEVYFGAVPIIEVEKNAASGEILRITPISEVMKAVVDKIPEPIPELPPKAAEKKVDSKGRLVRIVRGIPEIIINREKTLVALEEAIKNAVDSATVTIPIVKMERERDDSFDGMRKKLGFKVCLGESDTLHEEHRDDFNRNVNLKIAAEQIDGLVLQPGEEFSFNRIVGERSRKNGFLPAGVISNGRIIQGLGGGVCQVSTAIFNAALLANMKIVERYNHSIYEGIPYAKRGLDAAVVYGAKDFRFVNTMPFPVLIACQAGPGRVKAAIYGERKEFDSVEICTRNEETHPFTIQRKTKKGKSKGETKIIRPGVTGYTVEAFRIVRLGSQVREEKLHRDRYLMFPQIEEVSN